MNTAFHAPYSKSCVGKDGLVLVIWLKQIKLR